MIVDNESYTQKDSRSSKKLQIKISMAQVKKNMQITKLKSAQAAFKQIRENALPISDLMSELEHSTRLEEESSLKDQKKFQRKRLYKKYETALPETDSSGEDDFVEQPEPEIQTEQVYFFNVDELMKFVPVKTQKAIQRELNHTKADDQKQKKLIKIYQVNNAGRKIKKRSKYVIFTNERQEKKKEKEGQEQIVTKLQDELDDDKKIETEVVSQTNSDNSYQNDSINQRSSSSDEQRSGSSEVDEEEISFEIDEAQQQTLHIIF